MCTCNFAIACFEDEKNYRTAFTTVFSVFSTLLETSQMVINRQPFLVIHEGGKPPFWIIALYHARLFYNSLLKL